MAQTDDLAGAEQGQPSEWRVAHRGELSMSVIEEVIRAHDPGEAAEIIYWRVFRALTQPSR